MSNRRLSLASPTKTSFTATEPATLSFQAMASDAVSAWLATMLPFTYALNPLPKCIVHAITCQSLSPVVGVKSRAVPVTSDMHLCP